MIEIMLQKLYAQWGMNDHTDFGCFTPQDYPILSDLYELIESEYKDFDENKRQLYTAEMLQNILLRLKSLCVGAESKFFNAHTNITDSTFVTFGVKGLLQASKSLKNALLFNVLSFIRLHKKSDWQKHSFVALCGLSEQAMMKQLENNEKLKTVVLCLDNDIAGHSY